MEKNILLDSENFEWFSSFWETLPRDKRIAFEAKILNTLNRPTKRIRDVSDDDTEETTPKKLKLGVEDEYNPIIETENIAENTYTSIDWSTSLTKNIWWIILRSLRTHEIRSLCSLSRSMKLIVDGYPPWTKIIPCHHLELTILNYEKFNWPLTRILITQIGFNLKSSGSVLSALPQTLTSLRLEGSNFFDKNTMFLPSSLTELWLNSGKLTNDTLKNLPCKNLIRLDISGCSDITNIPQHFLPSLHYLNASGCKFGNSSFIDLPRSLKTLNLSLCPMIDSGYFRTLPRTLTSLNLNGCDKIMSSVFRYLPEGLTFLDVSYCKGITKFNNLPSRLLDLNLNGSEMFDYKHLSLLPSSLTILHVSQCKCIDHKILKHLPKNLKTLEYIPTCLTVDEGIPDSIYKEVYEIWPPSLEHIILVKDYYLISLLELACFNNDIKRVEVLYKQGYRLITNFNMLCLLKQKNKNLLKFMIENGLDSNSVVHTSKMNVTLLSWLCTTGNMELAKILISSKPNVIKKSTLLVALRSAIDVQHVELVKLLINAGAPVNYTQESAPVFDNLVHARTPLARACKRDCSKITELLLTHGADPHAGTEPRIACDCLQIAVCSGKTENVKLLLQYGVNPNRVLSQPLNPPLANAINKKYYEIVKLLLDHKANPNQFDQLNGSIPIQQACIQNDNKIVDLLLSYGADPNLDCAGANPLMYACSNENYEMVKALLYSKADPNKTDQHGKTAIYFAIKRRRTDIVQTLLDWKANPNVQDIDELSPLVCACIGNDTQMVELLLKYKANVNGEPGAYNPFYHAMVNLNATICDMLLQHNADLNVKTLDGAILTEHSCFQRIKPFLKNYKPQIKK